MGGILEKYPQLRIAFAHGRSSISMASLFHFVSSQVVVHFPSPLVVLITGMRVDLIYVLTTIHVDLRHTSVVFMSIL